jgi:hypothetical protein
MEHDLEKAQNLKLILSAFEQLSGLKINFHKSELFCFGEALNEVNAYANLFGCGQGQFPMRYLGILIHYRRFTLAAWKQVEERLQKRLSSWKGKLLSLGGRLVLINSVLSNMVLHMISFFLLPKGVLHKLDYYRSRFCWQGDSEKKKYRLAKWSVVCCPKDQGALGIHDLSVKNTALLGKWLFKLLTEHGTWQTILKRKYIGSSALSQVLEKPGDSHLWAGLMATKKHFFGLGTFLLRMDQRYVSGKINGLVPRPFVNSIRHCIVLCGTKAIPSLRFWRPLQQICRSEGICLVRGLYLGMPYSYVWQMSSYT